MSLDDMSREFIATPKALLLCSRRGIWSEAMDRSMSCFSNEARALAPSSSAGPLRRERPSEGPAFQQNVSLSLTVSNSTDLDPGSLARNGRVPCVTAVTGTLPSCTTSRSSLTGGGMYRLILVFKPRAFKLNASASGGPTGKRGTTMFQSLARDCAGSDRSS